MQQLVVYSAAQPFASQFVPMEEFCVTGAARRRVRDQAEHSAHTAHLNSCARGDSGLPVSGESGTPSGAPPLPCSSAVGGLFSGAARQSESTSRHQCTSHSAPSRL